MQLLDHGANFSCSEILVFKLQIFRSEHQKFLMLNQVIKLVLRINISTFIKLSGASKLCYRSSLNHLFHSRKVVLRNNRGLFLTKNLLIYFTAITIDHVSHFWSSSNYIKRLLGL